ncbi:MAG: cytochrome b/b6 domain-containing protein [Rubrivivax sp.]|nr:cytochrome b/b6 domain-containing protein [Rubrivivax sp.]
MPPSTTFDATAPQPAAARATAPSARNRRVVDAPVRLFHALFALCFIGAYLTAESEHWRALHVTLGYTFAAMLVLRVVYGLAGPRHAGIGSLWRKLGGAPAWLRAAGGAFRERRIAAVPWRQGQNLAMAAAVLALITLALPLALSGIAGHNEWGGAWLADALEEVHEFFGEVMLAVVLAHVGLVVALSLARRRNIATPMLTGRVEGAGPDLVTKNRAGLAAAVLAAVVAFWAWQWHSAPEGLFPMDAVSGAMAALNGARDDGDDDDD